MTEPARRPCPDPDFKTHTEHLFKPCDRCGVESCFWVDGPYFIVAFGSFQRTEAAHLCCACLEGVKAALRPPEEAPLSNRR